MLRLRGRGLDFYISGGSKIRIMSIVPAMAFIESQDLHAAQESLLLNQPTTVHSELDRHLMATALAQVSIASVHIDLYEDCSSTKYSGSSRLMACVSLLVNKLHR